MRISVLAWKPPAASTTHLALTSTVWPSCLTRTPLTPSSSAISDERAGAIRDGDIVLARDLGQRIDQPGPATHGLHREPAPELEHAADLVGLPSPDRHEAHALVAQPQHGRLAALDQDLAQVGIGAVFGDAAHVVEEFLLGVGAEVGFGDLLVGQVRHQRAQIVDAVIDAAERAGGEPAVAAGLVLRRALQHQHRDALLGRRQRGAKRRIAGANDDDIRGLG